MFINDVSAVQRVKYLRKLSEYKDILLATVSHDLRTPLNGIMGMITLVKERLMNDEISNNYLRIAVNSAKLLLFFINDILDFSQINNGKLRLTFKIIDVVDMAHEIYDLFEFQTKQKKIKFEVVNLIDNIAQRKVITDENRVKQVLLNFLSNALKFTFEGNFFFIHIVIYNNHYLNQN